MTSCPRISLGQRSSASRRRLRRCPSAIPAGRSRPKPRCAAIRRNCSPSKTRDSRPTNSSTCVMNSRHHVRAGCTLGVLRSHGDQDRGTLVSTNRFDLGRRRRGDRNAGGGTSRRPGCAAWDRRALPLRWARSRKAVAAGQTMVTDSSGVGRKWRSASVRGATTVAGMSGSLKVQCGRIRRRTLRAVCRYPHGEVPRLRRSSDPRARQFREVRVRHVHFAPDRPHISVHVPQLV